MRRSVSEVTGDALLQCYFLTIFLKTRCVWGANTEGSQDPLPAPLLRERLSELRNRCGLFLFRKLQTARGFHHVSTMFASPQNPTQDSTALSCPGSRRLRSLQLLSPS